MSAPKQIHADVLNQLLLQNRGNVITDALIIGLVGLALRESTQLLVNRMAEGEKDDNPESV